MGTQIIVGELRLGLVELNYDFLFQWINTLIMFFMMKHFLFKPVNKFMKDREEEIKNQFDDAANSKSEALSLKSEYEEKLRTAEAEGNEIIKEFRQKAESRATDIVNDAQNYADSLKEKANLEIEAQRQKAMLELKDQFSELTILAASKVLSREVTEKDNEKLISDFIAEAGEVKWIN